MRVLVACEFSGRVRDAFARLGHDAWSCDIRETEAPGNHVRGDVLGILNDDWDLMIAHPPCTYLSSVGETWMKPKWRWLYPDRPLNRREAFIFTVNLWRAPIPRICVENPLGWLNSHWRKPDQIIHPWMFGDQFNKRTCLWLKNLAPLEWAREDHLFGSATAVEPGEIVCYPGGGRMSRWYANSSSKERSVTFPGIARAMADQWGGPMKKKEASIIPDDSVLTIKFHSMKGLSLSASEDPDKPLATGMSAGGLERYIRDHRLNERYVSVRMGYYLIPLEIEGMRITVNQSRGEMEVSWNDPAKPKTIISYFPPGATNGSYEPSKTGVFANDVKKLSDIFGESLVKIIK